MWALWIVRALGLLPWPTWSRDVNAYPGQPYHFKPMYLWPKWALPKQCCHKFLRIFFFLLAALKILKENPDFALWERPLENWILPSLLWALLCKLSHSKGHLWRKATELCFSFRRRQGVLYIVREIWFAAQWKYLFVNPQSPKQLN